MPTEPTYKHLQLDWQNSNKILLIHINRPEVRNAFNQELIADLQDIFTKLSDDSLKPFADVRVICLRGNGPAFCGGGDLNWMKASLSLSADENLEDCQKLSHMFYTMDRCPKPLLGLVHGYAIGGGIGLVSVCDHVIAEESTIFSLSEVKLGLIPACIGPFVLAKIGAGHARSLFISGERFSAEKAKHIGLVHDVVKQENLQTHLEQVLKRVQEGGPVAIESAKFLIHTLTHDMKSNDFQTTMNFAASELANLRVKPEAQEGVRAFLEKRPPTWRK